MKKGTKKKIALFIAIGFFLIMGITLCLVYYLCNKDTYLYDIKIDNDTIKVYEDKLILNGDDIEYSEDNVHRFISLIEDNFEVNNNLLEVESTNLDNDIFLLFASIINKDPEANFNVESEKYDNVLYLDNRYVIYLKDNNQVRVKKIKMDKDNSKVSEIISTFDLNFSQENNQRVVDYLMRLFASDKKIFKSTIYKNEQNYINSIIYNDESYLNNADVNLKYIIKYVGLDCPSPTLYLYDDNTFEYYYTFALNDELLEPITGYYNPSVEDIMTEDTITYGGNYNSYVISDVQNDMMYAFDITSEMLSSFLTELNTPLDICLVQQ